MYGKIFLACVVATALGTTTQADPWKDESGHGRWGRGYGEFQEWKAEIRGEPPWWARGKGYGDGYFKDRRGGPPPWAGSRETHRYYAAPPYPQYDNRDRYAPQYYAPRDQASPPVYFEFRGSLEF